MSQVSRLTRFAVIGLSSVLTLNTVNAFGQEACPFVSQKKYTETECLQAQLAAALAREKLLKEENEELKHSLAAFPHMTEERRFRGDSIPQIQKETAKIAGNLLKEEGTAFNGEEHSLVNIAPAAGAPATAVSHQPPSAGTPAAPQTTAPAFYPAAHVDMHVRAGNRRAITGTDVWIPLRWDGRNLVFMDMRLSRDTRDEIEGNFGGGLRRVIDGRDGIWGLYGYYDIRRTAYDNRFSQATIGTEWLAEEWDARANAYIALNDEKSTTTTLPTTVSFSGTGLVARGGTSTLTEVPLSGLDLELGYKIPFAPWLPETRVYGGAYYFNGDGVGPIHGGRMRLHSDITDWLQIGAEYRDDNIRDYETLAEIRLRYSFGGAPSASPVRKLFERLDEQPVRDIDIVTGGSTTENVSTATVNNASSGAAQEIYFVDNTAAGGGDGSTETPFNTIAGALAVAGANDIIYVRAGDGTATGMDSGVLLNDNGQRLVGSGTNLTFGMLDLEVAGMSTPVDSYVIAAATSAPVITNTVAASDGITIAANDVFVAGVTVDSATRDGIRIAAGAGQNWQNAEIRDVTLSNNLNNGMALVTTGGGIIANPILANVTASHNLFDGISLNSSGAGSLIGGVNVADSLFDDNGRYGFYGLAQTAGDLGAVTITDTAANGNGEIGLIFQATAAGSEITSVSMNGVSAEDNADTGIYINAATGGLISAAALSDMIIRDNGEHGFYVHSSGAGSMITSASLSDSFLDNNSGYGFYGYATGGSDIGSLTVGGTTIQGGGASGHYVVTDNATSVISSYSLTDSTISDNDDHGVYLYANAGQVTTATITNVTTQDNRANGYNIGSNAATGQIGTLTMTGDSATGNSDHGAYIYTASGTLGTVTLSDLDLQDNNAYGLYVSATGATGLITSLSVEDSLIENNAGYGLMLETTTAADITATALSGLTIRDNEEHGLYMTANGAGSLIGDVTFADSEIERSANYGLHAYATAGGDFNSIDIYNVDITDSGSHGYYLYTDNAGSLITTVTVSDSTATDNANNGFYVYANAGQITTATLSDLVSTNNGDQGYDLRAAGATGLINSVSLSDSIADGNGDTGVYVYATGGADITTATLSGLTSEGNGSHGYLVYAYNSATSVIGNISLTDSTATDNANNGFYVYANNGEITTATLSDLVSANNGDVGYSISANTATGLIGTLSLSNASSTNDVANGLYLYAAGGGDITTATLSNINVTDSDGTGIYIAANAAGSVITNLSLTDSSSVENAIQGIYIGGQSGGQIAAATLDELTATGNRASGIYVDATGASQLNSVLLTDSIAADNFDYGIYLNASGTSVFSAMAQGVTASGNYQYGVYVNDDTTGAFTADLGGGALGSTGGNRIFGSMIEDIRVDLDNLQLKAENNWWGEPLGLQVSERLLDGASTIDSTPFLAADPGP
ncbi:MAG: inverse autotransporter beta domain-containing protein [Micavibrio aeruginosavorus]|uniref:Inverse autotransporter beta domain-containing protein n=1 Tax=Micavibrio aeruginosavorus TaxID=349221 RepID=A0A7T5UIF8_9BACT|nr:MAG: inverse autotransporter beta domain-containing protein [Micavibrio aeruginosavorus]